MGHPTIYPTGVTIYNPEKCWNGLTIFQAQEVGAVLMDMNGREHNVWKGVHGFPNKIFPGGYLVTSRGRRTGKYSVQDQTDVVQLDWNGKEVWKFDRNEYIEDPGYEPRWMARYHHDFQREGSTVGYYAPDMEPKSLSGNTLVLCHKNARNKNITDKLLLDDVILEVDWDGDIVWEWRCNAWATGCTSTPCPCLVLINGMIRAINASTLIILLWTAVNPILFSLLKKQAAKLCGNSVPIIMQHLKKGLLAGLSDSTMHI